MSEKLQKVLASCGYGSRRQVETWISEGRITVNGKVATIGDRVTEKDRIYLNGRPVKRDHATASRVLMLNKPAGVICTSRDPQKRETVFQLLPKIKRDRWILVGRLDLNTSGLLLVTNDGLLAQRLMHPSQELEREYLVRVFGEVTPAIIANLKKGVEIDGEIMRFSRIKEQPGAGKNQWFQVCLKEGKYREVRRLWESQGLKVSRLIRTRFGNLSLPKNLRAGAYRELSSTEIDKLKKTVGLD